MKCWAILYGRPNWDMKIELLFDSLEKAEAYIAENTKSETKTMDNKARGCQTTTQIKWKKVGDLWVQRVKQKDVFEKKTYDTGWRDNGPALQIKEIQIQ